MSLIDTGERLLTSYENKTTVEHLHRYAFASNFTDNKLVLDIASGEGYGTSLLAKNAKYVYGIDISKDAISHAKNKYKEHNIQFLEGLITSIPLEDQSIDVVVSFETIEHGDKHEEMMSEFQRVLKPDGVLIISSPDKKYYTDIPNYKNPFHVKELYMEEFYALVSKYFKKSFLYKQGIVNASLIYSENSSNQARGISVLRGNFDEINDEIDIVNPEYNIIIGANAEIEIPKNSIYESNVLDSLLQQKIERLNQKVKGIYRSKTYRIGKVISIPVLFIGRLFRKSG